MPTRLPEISPPQEKMCCKDSTVNLWQLSDTSWWERHSRDFFGRGTALQVKTTEGYPGLLSAAEEMRAGAPRTHAVCFWCSRNTPHHFKKAWHKTVQLGLCWAQGFRRIIKDNSAQDQLPFSGLKDPDLQAISTHSWAKIPARCSSDPEDAHVNTWAAMQWFRSRH